MVIRRLRALRTARHLYQKDVADILKIDRTTYAKYETGDSEPSIATLIQIADLYHVTMDYLLERNDVKNEPEDAELLQIFHQLTEEGKSQVKSYAEFVLQSPDTRQEDGIASAV